MADTKISALTASTTPLAGTEVLPIVQSGTTKQVSVANLTAGRAIAATNITASGEITSTTNDARLSLYRATGINYFDWASGQTLAFGTQTSQSGAGRVNKVNFTDAGNVEIANGNLVISTSGKGIDFSATPGTGTSELLADYEEGTWTPVVAGSTGAGTYELSANTSCSYQKVGNNVTVLARIVAAAVVTGGGTGDIRISGLPFNMSATVYGSPFAAVCSGVAFTGSFLAAERVTGGATATVYPYGIDNAGAQTQVPIANFAANDIISFQFQYRV